MEYNINEVPIDEWEFKVIFNKIGHSFDTYGCRKIVVKGDNFSKIKFCQFHEDYINIFLKFFTKLKVGDTFIDKCIIEKTIVVYYRQIKESNYGEKYIDSLKTILYQMIKFCIITKLPLNLFDVDRLLYKNFDESCTYHYFHNNLIKHVKLFNQRNFLRLNLSKNIRQL